MELKVGNRTIGMNHPTYFIADIAASHDGDLERAKLLIRLAREAVADAAKFQNFDAPKIVSDYGFSHMNSQVSHQATWRKSVVEVYRAASIRFEWTMTLAPESDDTSYSRSGRYLVYNNTLWTDAADDQANRAWHSSATALLDPHKIGRYVGETDLTKESDVAQQCYTPETWARLRKVRATYDPEGRFHDYLGVT